MPEVEHAVIKHVKHAGYVYNEATNQKVARLHPHQSKAFASKARFVALVAGTGGGKTFMGPPWLCNEISKHPNDQWLIMAPTYKILSRATIPTFLDYVSGTKFEGALKESKGIYHLPDGGVIYLVSADNWKSVEGGQYRGAWLDEAGQMGHMSWIAIQARLGLKQGRCLFTTTPYPTADADWLLVDVVKMAKKGDPDYFAIQFKSIDNPHYPKAEYERARRSMPPALFEMRYGGKFTKLAGLVYPDLDRCITDKPIPKEALDGTWEKFGGLDWGFRDPFCALVGAMDKDHVLHLFYEHYLSRTPIAVHANQLIQDGMQDVLYFGDPSGAQQIADMGACDLSVVKANNSILAGIETVTYRMQTGGLIIYEDQCPNLVRESDIYRYAAKEEVGAVTRSSGEGPLDKDNHAPDALRYLIRGLDGDSMGDTQVGMTDKELEAQEATLKKSLSKEHKRYQKGQSIALGELGRKRAQERMRNRFGPYAGVAQNIIQEDEKWLSPHNDAIFNIHSN